MSRLSYEESCHRLHVLGFPDCDPAPPMPTVRPRHDDENPLGVNFFRTIVEGDLSNLTLPRTFFGRSEIKAAIFRNTDLRESTLCWNDFIDVEFDLAVLRESDLRAAVFERVSFADADLGGADFRHSTFQRCSFSGASMNGTVLTNEQGARLALSVEQHAQICWVDNSGEEPDGG